MKLICLMLIAIFAVASAPAAAQSYPSRPVSLVVPFAAGSGTDAVARVVAKKLGERFNQTVIVDNKPGASAQIATNFVANAKPDGYTLLMTTNTGHSANPSLFKQLSYDPVKGFTPITLVGELPFAVVVNNKLPVKNMKEFVDYAKANPGRLTYGTPNSTSLVASETIKRLAGIDLLGVPYKSSPQAMTDLIGGQIDFYVVDLGSGMAMIKANKVKTLAITTKAPSNLLPDVPPVAQTITGFDLTSWNGIFGPANVPKPIVDQLNTEILAVLADKEVQEQLLQQGFQVGPSASTKEFANYVEHQLVHWRTLIKQAGIQPE
ncbi:Bug family tripartite tricarboxylate transporter substrate binding protein [Noviherbaspirillum suwonense]|uniref:Tripartite-type tricarboxylate transporter, receptor component TctC n=1 Tax=Noviherbaspirillum suwonense TaxID=1224511 RepID=A0ABY1QSP2_9BURK|nr:tripartite tricarboxylate transporter substrate binding protein [Noviherbaspirillum suwonense]SMP78996.1 Tripartite-type tricarboxylate transporter, receptor component TctC [Noviherbaspirillum suwonense]